MTYIVGRFERYEDGMYAGTVSKLTKDHLVKCKEDDEYHIIAIANREYFDPHSNSWKPLPNYDKP